MTTLSTRQTFALVALFVVTSLTFIQLDSRRALDPIKDGLYAVVSPATEAFGRVGDGRSGGGSAVERELAAVKAERNQLAAEVSRLRAENREVEQLREQAKLQQKYPSWKMLQARVRNTDPNNQQMSLIIDKGSADGVEVGMAVVAEGPNYIGRVTRVEGPVAEVTLVVDVSHTVGARLDGGADGVVYGMWTRGGRLELRHLDRNVRAEPDELVLTTDSATVRTARVPGGLILGRVGEDVARNRQGDEQTVPVIPLVAFEQLQVVTVVLTDGA